MNKKILFFFTFICFAALAINLFISLNFNNKFFQILDYRRQEQTKIYQYQNYLSRMKDAETGQRGYVITGESSYLEPYQQALSYFEDPKFKSFIEGEINSGDPSLRKQVEELEKIRNEKFNELAFTIALRKNKGFDVAQKVVMENAGRNLMDQIRNGIFSIIKSKDEKLFRVDTNVQTSASYTDKLLIFNNLVAGILLALCLFSIYRSIKKLEIKELDLSRALHGLNDSLATQEAILMSVNNAIISFDPKGIITTFNPAAEKILGYAKDEVVGKKDLLVFHDFKELENRSLSIFKQIKKTIPPGIDIFKTLARENLHDTNEWTYIRRDGSRISVLLTLSAIKNIEKQIIGYVGVLYNNTERKEIERMKAELIAITNHELRSPLASIKGAFDLLSQQEFALSDLAKDVLVIGQKNCKRLVHLTDDILDIQKIESGNINFNFKKLNVSGFLYQAIQANKFIAQKSQVNLTILPIPPNWFILADEDRLMQVANNLISNAIKYSSPNGIVEVRAQMRNSMIRVEVCDHGEGIQEEFHPKVFEKFARVSTPMGEEKKNLGLGLNIAKSIIEMHNGTIDFKSSPGQTTFWFELQSIDP